MGLWPTPVQNQIVQIPRLPSIGHEQLLASSCVQPQEGKEEIRVDVKDSGARGGIRKDVRHCFQSGCPSSPPIHIKNVGSYPPPPLGTGGIPQPGGPPPD